MVGVLYMQCSVFIYVCVCVCVCVCACACACALARACVCALRQPFITSDESYDKFMSVM